MKPERYICITCGTQYALSQYPPAICKICADERQYVNPGGQQWTTLSKINARHQNSVVEIKSHLYEIVTQPGFGIGQRAHLLQTPRGNILWDCIANLTKETIDIITHLGGIDAIAISHPHYYTTMGEWSRAFGNAPVYLHQLDEEWICNPDLHLKLWAGDTIEVLPGVTLIHCRGHFAGGAALHYDHTLLTGDIIQVCPDLKSVSFMYSYPNYIPLRKKDILGIRQALDPFAFETIHGAFGHVISRNAREVFEFSVDRYLDIYR